MNSVFKIYRLSNKLYKKNIPVFPKILKILIRIMFSGVIPYSCEIGENTILGYNALGIVIHGNVKIGKNCTVSQCVTIGGTRGKVGVPVIGDNVTIGAGATILGPVKIGDNAIIGAGAVVVNDVLKSTVVAGVPAKRIK